MDLSLGALILVLLGSNGFWTVMHVRRNRAETQFKIAEAEQADTDTKTHKVAYDQDTLFKYEQLATKVRELIDKAMEDHRDKTSLTAATEAQRQAARANGKLGGRPRKVPEKLQTGESR